MQTTQKIFFMLLASNGWRELLIMMISLSIFFIVHYLLLRFCFCFFFLSSLLPKEAEARRQGKAGINENGKGWQFDWHQ
jgi:hypothetical protein